MTRLGPDGEDNEAAIPAIDVSNRSHDGSPVALEGWWLMVEGQEPFALVRQLCGDAVADEVNAGVLARL